MATPGDALIEGGENLELTAISSPHSRVETKLGSEVEDMGMYHICDDVLKANRSSSSDGQLALQTNKNSPRKYRSHTQ
jgi:hypothetical protein